MIPEKISLRHTQWELIIYRFPEGADRTTTDEASLDFGDCGYLLGYTDKDVHKALARMDAYKQLGSNHIEIGRNYLNIGLIDLDDAEGNVLGRLQAVACEDGLACKKCYR